MSTSPMSTTARRSIALVMFAGMLIVAGTARAQTPPTEVEQRAELLFREGRALLDQGKEAEACPKFEDSQRLDPGLGTLLNLADCYERTDRLASALTAFRGAEEQARTLGEKKREVAATDRARSLEARVSRVSITLATGERPTGFMVRRNGIAVTTIDLGRAIAVDPGPVVIEATAPGWKTFAKTFTITKARATESLEIPQLSVEDAVQPPDVTPPVTGPRPPMVDPGRGRRRLGYIVGGAGVVALGAGVAIGLVAKGKWQDAIDEECGGDPSTCSDAGKTRADDARGLGNIGTIVGGVGVAAIAAGAVLWFTAPTAHAVEVAPMVGPDAAGVTLAGRF